MEDIRKRSGEVNTDDPMVVFLYVLMRDYVTAGVVEEIVKKHCSTVNEGYKLSNGWLAQHAIDVVTRLTTG